MRPESEGERRASIAASASERGAERSAEPSNVTEGERRASIAASASERGAEPSSATEGERQGAEPGIVVEALAEQVFIALADPSRRSILAALAAKGPATVTDLADRLPITRQAIAKHLARLNEAGLVTAEPGERRRVRYRLNSGPMRVAQQFLAALARDWDGQLDALRRHLNE